jgi:predicted  nucleic acid-binding Zn-ribbon protein
MGNAKAEPPKPYLKEHVWDRYGAPPQIGEKLGEPDVFTAQDFADLKLLESLQAQLEDVDISAESDEQVDDLEAEMDKVEAELNDKTRALTKVKAQIAQSAQAGEIHSLPQTSLRQQLKEQTKALWLRLDNLQADLDYLISGQDVRDLRQEIEEEITKLKDHMLTRHPEWAADLEAGLDPTTGNKMWYGTA